MKDFDFDICKKTQQNPNDKKAVEELYAEYVVWCDVNNFKTVKSTRFETEIGMEFKVYKRGTMFVDK